MNFKGIVRERLLDLFLYLITRVETCKNRELSHRLFELSREYSTRPEEIQYVNSKPYRVLYPELSVEE